MRIALLALLFAGSVFGQALPRTYGNNSGDVTLASIGSTPAAAGASLLNQVLTLQPADATRGGVLSATTQSILGAKTFLTSVASPAITSSAASGANAFGVDTNGARIDFGAGAGDYCSSNGTSVTCNPPWIFANTATMPDLYFDAMSASTTWPINFRSLSAQSATTRMFKWNNNGTDIASLYFDGQIRQVGVATGSLQTCAAGIAGSIQYDSTTNTEKICNGTSWLPFGTVALTVTSSQDPASVAAGTCNVFTLALTGSTTSDFVACRQPAGLEANLAVNCSAGTDVIGFRLCNVQTVGAIDPANGTWGAKIIR